MIVSRLARGLGAASSILAVAACATTDRPQSAAAEADWPTAQFEPGATRHSPLRQVNPSNVASLRPAWTYHMKPASWQVAAAPNAAERAQTAAEQAGPPPAGQGGPPGGPGGPMGAQSGGRFNASQSIPLVVKGVMYLATPYSRVVALNAATGAELWVSELPKGVNPATRGTEYWPGNATSPPALIFGTNDGKLRSLNAADGTPSQGFGTNGIVDLRTPDIMVGGPGKPYALSSPPLVYRNLVITGAQVGEAIGGSRGDVRAWDAATGRLIWTFKSVPGAGEPGADSWGNNSGFNRSGVQRLGLADGRCSTRHRLHAVRGADQRSGRRRSAWQQPLQLQSLVAADANTGKYLWHFQLVHHDIWDDDAPARRRCSTCKQGRPDHPRGRGRSTRSGCCSSSTASPASRSTGSRNGQFRRAMCRAK